MSCRHHFTAAVLLATLLAPFALAAGQSAPPAGILKVGIELPAQPFSFVDEKSRLTGFAVDLIIAVAANQSLDIQLRSKPWPDVYDDFLAGKFDILPNVAYSSGRTRQMDFSVRHTVMKSALFTRKNDHRFHHTADFAGRRLAVLRDSYAHEYAQKAGWTDALVVVERIEDGFAGVERGDYDGVFAMRLIGNHLIRRLGLTQVRPTDVQLTGLTYELRMGVQPGNALLLAKLNQGLANIRANGDYDRIYEKWIGPLEPRTLRLSDLLPYLGTFALVLLAIFAAFLWQRRLLHKISDQAAALRLSEERLMLVIEGGGHGLWDLNLTTGQIQRNQRAAAMLGYRPEEISPTYDGWMQLVHPDDRSRLLALRERTRRPGEDDFALEYRARAQNGEWKWIYSQGKVMERAPDGEPLRAAGTHTDITPRKRAEEEQDRLERKMVEAQKLESLGVMAGGIAHDFNNLLTAILGNCALARLDPANGLENSRRLEKILTAANRAADLCRQMLAYAGQGAFAIERFNLNDLVRETTQLLDLSLSKHATLEFELAESLPSIDGDPSQIRQIIMNLVMNASEALGEDEGRIHVATSTGRLTPADLTDALPSAELPAGDYVCLAVTDTGCGMTPEVMARIFDPFFTTKFTGRGLGLAAVIGIVRSHRGALKVRSTPGRGSVFRILLPVASVQDEAASDAAREVPPAIRACGTILLAEDEPAVRTVIADVLASLGFEIVSAKDGHEALEQFRATPASFAAVLLDMVMPRLDGVAALREMHALRPTVPAVIVSGFGEQEARRRFAGLEVAGFIQKPITFQSLADLMISVTRNR